MSKHSYSSADLLFMRMALQVAEASKDPDEKVGCILVSPDKRQLAYGFNGFPQGVPDKEEWLTNKEVKNKLMVHAELNALLNCHTRPEGWSLYVTKPPCLHCALTILNSGISSVITPRLRVDSRHFASQTEAVMLMEGAGVLVKLIALEIGETNGAREFSDVVAS